MVRFIKRFAIVSALLIVSALFVSGCQFTPPGQETASSPPSTPVPQETTQAENVPPVIISVEASPEQIAPLATAEVRCRAEDSDGSELFYSWSIQAGSISGSGEQVAWKAPAEEGHYSIGVTVTDRSGGAVTGTAYVSVAAGSGENHSPAVSMMVQPAGQPPFEFFPGQDPVKIRQWSTTIIRCKAQDPDGDDLTIEWDVTGGDLDGEGEKVTYIAKERNLQTITATVTDSTGRQTQAQVVFNVQCCGGH